MDIHSRKFDSTSGKKQKQGDADQNKGILALSRIFELSREDQEELKETIKNEEEKQFQSATRYANWIFAISMVVSIASTGLLGFAFFSQLTTVFPLFLLIIIPIEIPILIIAVQGIFSLPFDIKNAILKQEKNSFQQWPFMKNCSSQMIEIKYSHNLYIHKYDTGNPARPATLQDELSCPLSRYAGVNVYALARKMDAENEKSVVYATDIDGKRPPLVMALADFLAEKKVENSRKAVSQQLTLGLKISGSFALMIVASLTILPGVAAAISITAGLLGGAMMGVKGFSKIEENRVPYGIRILPNHSPDSGSVIIDMAQYSQFLSDFKEHTERDCSSQKLHTPADHAPGTIMTDVPQDRRVRRRSI